MAKKRATWHKIDFDPPAERDWRDDRDEAPVASKASAFRAKGPGQAAFLDAIDHNDVVFGVGPAGAGKTSCAVARAAQALDRGSVKSISLWRPHVGVGRPMGFLPGDANAKLYLFFQYILDEFRKHYKPEAVDAMILKKVIKLGSLEHIRSATFEDEFALFDEAQNALKTELRTFLGRLGPGSKIVVCGDIGRDQDGTYKQCDYPHAPGHVCAFEDYSRRFSHLAGVARIEMTSVDIVRHPLVRAMVEAGL